MRFGDLLRPLRLRGRACHQGRWHHLLDEADVPAFKTASCNNNNKRVERVALIRLGREACAPDDAVQSTRMPGKPQVYKPLLLVPAGELLRSTITASEYDPQKPWRKTVNVVAIASGDTHSAAGNELLTSAMEMIATPMADGSTIYGKRHKEYRYHALLSSAAAELGYASVLAVESNCVVGCITFRVGIEVDARDVVVELLMLRCVPDRQGTGARANHCRCLRPALTPRANARAGKALLASLKKLCIKSAPAESDVHMTAWGINETVSWFTQQGGDGDISSGEDDDDDGSDGDEPRAAMKAELNPACAVHGAVPRFITNTKYDNGRKVLHYMEESLLERFKKEKPVNLKEWNMTWTRLSKLEEKLEARITRAAERRLKAAGDQEALEAIDAETAAYEADLKHAHNQMDEKAACDF